MEYKLYYFLLIPILLSACGQRNEVIVYTSHDQNLSEPILDKFEQTTGIDVKTVYDIEANKSTGLVNRLIAEKLFPRADVFWNNEHLRTIKLKEEGVLEQYYPKFNANSSIVRYSDRSGYWIGFAARARVFIINKKYISKENEPARMYDLLNSKWNGKIAIANPHFGTTGTHFSTLLKIWGEDKFKKWLIGLRNNNVAILPGNGQVKDKVAAGEYWIGLTDTDDVNGALLDNKPVKMIIPDQAKGGDGMLLIPNTVALIKAGPNPENAKRLINFILSDQVEEQLALGRGAQIPILHKVPGPSILPDIQNIGLMRSDYASSTSSQMTKMLSIYRSIFHSSN